MSTIYKYPIQPGLTVLELPRGAQVLTVQMQGDRPFLWARLDTRQPPERRTFEVFGTGDGMPDDPRLMYVATFQMEGGSLVWHVFEWPTEWRPEAERRVRAPVEERANGRAACAALPDLRRLSWPSGAEAGAASAAPTSRILASWGEAWRQYM